MFARLTILAFIVLLSFSCGKEYSCEGCMPGSPGPPGPPGPATPSITSLNCATGSFSANAVEGILYSGVFTISYNGGNSAAFKADTVLSTGITGFTAIRAAGSLSNGNGTITYSISGTGATAGNAVFAISLAGKICTATLTVEQQVTVLNGIIKSPIAAEKEHNLAVLGNGIIKAWGNNQFGQLGDGTTTHRYTPVEITTLANIASVAAGAYHSLALRKDGKVWAWGKNDHGQLGSGNLTENHLPQHVTTLSNVISIAAGFDYSLALKVDGTVWAWGGNEWGVLGDVSYTDKYLPVQVNGLSDIIAIAAGTEHCLALKNDGSVWSWGWNANGCLGDGSNITKRALPAMINGLPAIKAITANGSIHSLALANDGTIWSWGDNFYGQLGDGTLIQKNVPTQVTSITGAVTIGTGERHSFAVKADGTLWSWGWNGNGQLGTDFTLSFYQPAPISVQLLTGVKKIAGGSFHSIALKDDGTVYTMGSNVYGQLGDGSNVLNRYQPGFVLSL